MRVTIDNSILTDIADSIREKGGASGLLAPQAMAEAIQAISGGGGITDIDEGIFTTQADLTTYTIANSRGIIPKAIIIMSDDNNIPYCHRFTLGTILSGNLLSTMAYNVNTGGISTFTSAYNSVSEMTETQIVLNSRGGNYTFKTGVNYHYWIIY